MRDTRVRAIRSCASLQVERRQRERLVVDDLHRRAAAPEHHDGPEGRIVGEPGDQFARLRSPHHRLDGDAGDAGVWLQALGALEDVGGRLAHRLLAGQVELDAADVGFVHDVGREDLHRDRAALGDDGRAAVGGLIRRRGQGTGAVGMS